MTVLISVLAVIFVALLLWHLPQMDYDDVFGVPDAEPIEEPPPGAEDKGFPVGDPQTEVGYSDIEIFRRNRDGRLTHAIFAKMRPREPAGRADLLDPRMIFYASGGEQFHVRAPRGMLDTEGAVVARFNDIKRGALWGGVVMRHDRGTPDDESDDLVVRMDRCEYDQREARFHTDDPVTVRGPEVEMDAVGMVALLVRGENELKELRFLRDITMTLQGQEGEALAVGMTPTARSEPSGGSAPAGPAEAESAEPATDREEQTGEGGRFYRFTLKGNVRVEQPRGDGTRGLEADRQVELVTRSEGDSLGGGPDASRAGAPSAADRGQPRADGGSGPPEEAAPAPVEVVCDGPFTFEPVPSEEAPGGLQLKATGRRVVLWEPRMRATGDDFSFDGATGIGVLRDSERTRVMLAQGPDKRTEIVSREVRFDRDNATAAFAGPGRLVVDVPEEEFAGVRAEGDRPLKATWRKAMNVDFAGQRTPQGELRNVLDRAEFHGSAVLRQGRRTLSGEHLVLGMAAPEASGGQYGIRSVTASGDVAVIQPEAEGQVSVGDLTCGYLEFHFRQDDRGESRPTTLFARENVVGTAENSNLEADRLSVHFEADPEQPDRDVVQRLVAEGNVRARRDDRYAEGRYLEYSTEARLPGEGAGAAMVLRGTENEWATALLGPHRIRGVDITMDRTRRRVDAKGPGRLKLMSNRGIEGGERESPMPITVAWTRKMIYNGVESQAHFSGRAEVRLPGAGIDCADLWIFFMPAGGEEERSEDQAFEAVDVKRLTASKNVVARRVQTPDDPEEDVTVATIHADVLEYKTLERSAVVDGPGRLEVVEVGRVPADVPPRDREPHNRTTVRWERGMKFDRRRAMAWFARGVVAEVFGLAVNPETGEVDRAGRGQRTLRCQILRAYLQSDESEASDEVAGLSLKELVAHCGPEPPYVTRVVPVTFEDGSYRGTARRMTYNRRKQLVVLTGDPARVWKKGDGNFGRYEGDRMSYRLDSKRVEILEPRGGIFGR